MKKIKPITNNKLGMILRQKRRKLGISLREAAKTCDVPFGYLAAVERGEVERPKIKMLESLCRLYGLSVDEIIIMARKIPQDVYWKMVNNPSLLSIIRNIEV